MDDESTTLDERADEIFRMIGALGMYWLKHPELRMVQVIGNLAADTPDSYFIEDAEMYKRMTGR